MDEVLKPERIKVMIETQPFVPLRLIWVALGRDSPPCSFFGQLTTHWQGKYVVAGSLLHTILCLHSPGYIRYMRGSSNDKHVADKNGMTPQPAGFLVEPPVSIDSKIDYSSVHQKFPAH